ncbi:MAG: hypothetical protein KDA77_02085 [Planctomycetaceae bacterium]|nr:hypothetical protein [Planctomycetaceae bacterium]
MNSNKERPDLSVFFSLLKRDAHGTPMIVFLSQADLFSAEINMEKPDE